MLAVLTAADVAADGLQPLRPYAEANVQTGERFTFDAAAAAGGRTRSASCGEPVALVVAETRAQALDAAELIAVDYEPLPAVTSADAAVASGAPQLSPTRCRAISAWTGTGRRRRRRRCGLRPRRARRRRSRSTTTASSPTRWSRAARSARYDPASGRYTLHVSSQSIHANRDHAARALGVEPADVRFIAPDVGGGFGAKNFIYAEHVLILWAAQRGRPAGEMDRHPQRGLPRRPPGARPCRPRRRWRSTRRASSWRCEVASVANVGAYLAGVGGGVQTYQYVHLQGTVYRMPVDRAACASWC